MESIIFLTFHSMLDYFGLVHLTKQKLKQRGGVFGVQHLFDITIVPHPFP